MKRKRYGRAIIWVTRPKATRQYIEDTLLLSLSEIEKYPVSDAIANL